MCLRHVCLVGGSLFPIMKLQRISLCLLEAFSLAPSHLCNTNTCSCPMGKNETGKRDKQASFYHCSFARPLKMLYISIPPSIVLPYGLCQIPSPCLELANDPWERSGFCSSTYLRTVFSLKF